MRRTPYSEKFQRSYLKVGTKKASESANNSFKLQINKLSEDNFIAPRTPNSFYQPRTVKPVVYRPNTTNKPTSLLDFKRQSDPANIKLQQRQLYVNTFKEHSRDPSRDNNYIDQLKGRLYRGSSWKHQQKFGRQHNFPSTSRYVRQKRDQLNQSSENDKKSRKSSGLLDLIGQNLKKSEAANKDDDFFQYIMRFSYRTKKGYIPTNSSKVNQDSFIINPNISSKTWQHLFAVCDGHGPLGHQVSGFIKNTLPGCVSGVKMIERHPKEGLAKAFELAYQKLLRQSNIDMSFSGSTVISCYLQQNKLLCANVGDSRAIMGRTKGNNTWEAIALSTDHKPTIQKEVERIKKMKGRVEPFKDQYGDPIGPQRVWVMNDNVPGLAMTRSFGDLVGASVGVSPIPEIKQFRLTDADKIIIIGSDGVFQFLQNEEIIRAMVPFYQSKQIQQASDHLMSMANRSWTKNSSIIDDITFILIFISYNEM